jgi:hypothetical protein
MATDEPGTARNQNVLFSHVVTIHPAGQAARESVRRGALTTTLSELSAEPVEQAAENVEYPVLGGFSQSRKHREAQESAKCALSDRKVALTIPEPLSIVRMKMDWNIVHIYANADGAQLAENGVASGAKCIEVQEHGIQVISVLNIGANHRHRQFGATNERRVVPPGERTATSQERVESTQLGDAECTLDVGDAVVITEVHHFVEPSITLALGDLGRDSVVPELTHPFRVTGIG